MLITNEEDKEIIINYLNNEYLTESGKTCKSSYLAALRHARESTGRNIKTGIMEMPENSGNWAGACMYLILIDHIGKIFYKNNKVLVGKNAFFKALEAFSGIPESEREILYQLRNSFLHQFNLYNIPTAKNYIPRHFSVNRDDVLISEPTIAFDGNLSNITDKNSTSISLLKIGDLVEQMHKDIISSLEKGEIEVDVPSNTTFEDLLLANIICYYA